MAKKAKYESLTAEKLKQFPGFEHLTDEQAEETTASIREFASILVQFPIDKIELPNSDLPSK